MEFRPPVPEGVRLRIEREIEARGPGAVHAGLPERFRERIHPNDRSRIARISELLATGQEPAPDHVGGGELWTARLRKPSLLVGLVEDDSALRVRIAARVEAMASAGAGLEAQTALNAGASRTARAAIGFKEFLDGDLELAAERHRRYAKRQMTWMRRMHGVELLARSGRDDRSLATAVLDLARSFSFDNAGDTQDG
jgi:tRNA dimethylallyltransferase